MSAKKYSKLQNGSDIRGVATDGVPGEPVTLTRSAVEDIASGFVIWLSKKIDKPVDDLCIAVGRDPRISGEDIADAFMSAASSYGCRLIDCGLASTPAMFMATKFDEIDADGSVIITASHLPFNRNGLKFFTKESGLDKSDIKEILSLAESETSNDSTAENESAAELAKSKLTQNNYDKLSMLKRSSETELAKRSQGFDSKFADSDQKFESHSSTMNQSRYGELEKPNKGCGRGLTKLNQNHNFEFNEGNLMELYCSHLRNIIVDACPPTANTDKPLENLKIAVDAGNGSGGFFATNVLEPLGADISASRFLEPDGRFPNHPPNPENKEAMTAIRDATLEGNCDLGLIFDTDVDRSSAVDEKGREINRNGIVAMASALVSENHPHTTVVTDSVTSEQLTDYLTENLGLKHLRFRRGYRNVINKAIELNNEGVDSALAIETSGHAAFRDNYFLDDGAYLAVLIVIRTAILKSEGKGISSVISSLEEAEEAVEIRLPLTGTDFSSDGDKILENLRSVIETMNTENTRLNNLGTNVAISNDSETSAGNEPEPNLKFSLARPNYEGVRVSFTGSSSGWFLFRKSLHDPIMPLNIESNEKGGVKMILGFLKNALKHEEGIDISQLTV